MKNKVAEAKVMSFSIEKIWFTYFKTQIYSMETKGQCESKGWGKAIKLGEMAV